MCINKDDENLPSKTLTMGQKKTNMRYVRGNYKGGSLYPLR